MNGGSLQLLPSQTVVFSLDGINTSAGVGATPPLCACPRVCNVVVVDDDVVVVAVAVAVVVDVVVSDGVIAVVVVVVVVSDVVVVVVTAAIGLFVCICWLWYRCTGLSVTRSLYIQRC